MSKNFAQFFFQGFLRFFEVCSSGDLVNFLEVCSSGVLEEISLLSHQYPSRVHPSGVSGRRPLVLTDGWVVMGGGGDGWVTGSRNRKKSRILKISQKLFDIFF